MYTADQRNDHAHDLRKHEPSPRHQKRAVSDLVAYCHGLIAGGLAETSPEIAKQLHARVCNVCTEFDMDKPPAPTPAGAISRVMLREPV